MKKSLNKCLQVSPSKFEEMEEEIKRLESKESFYKVMHESSNRPAVYFMANNKDNFKDSKDPSVMFPLQ